jgi:hypothetical protein
LNRSGGRSDVNSRTATNRTTKGQTRASGANRNSANRSGVSDRPTANRDGKAGVKREPRANSRSNRNARNPSSTTPDANGGNRNRGTGNRNGAGNTNRRGNDPGNGPGANGNRGNNNGNNNGANRGNRNGRAGGVNRGNRGGLNNRGNGRGNRGGRGNHRHNLRNNFFFGLGGNGFGFGYYGGFGYYSNTFWGNPGWNNWGFNSNFFLPYYYPRYRGYYYPYYWSSAFYSGYRDYATNYVTYREPYVSTVYLPSGGFDDDPFASEDDLVIIDTSTGADVTTPGDASSSPGPAVVPIIDGVDGGLTFASARSLGDNLMRSGNAKQAAEAYRQAWIHDGTQDGLGRMSAALITAGDFPTAAWAMIGQVEGDQKNLLDQGLLYNELLGGPGVTKATKSLERYLINNPNDEGSNLLLASMYVYSGREFSGYMILGRLDAAGYAPETTKLFLNRAKASLAK